MKYVCNSYIDKLEFLPDEIELAVTKSWCHSVISFLNRIESYEELIFIINTCINSSEHKHDSPGHVSKYVIMSVGNIKKIINIYGKETLCYILPYNYEHIANDFLCSKLGEVKNQIDLLVGLENYEEALNIISSIDNKSLKRLALIYMKSIYMLQTENKIESFVNTRKKIVDIINSKIKESPNYF